MINHLHINKENTIKNEIVHDSFSKHVCVCVNECPKGPLCTKFNKGVEKIKKGVHPDCFVNFISIWRLLIFSMFIYCTLVFKVTGRIR